MRYQVKLFALALSAVTVPQLLHAETPIIDLEAIDQTVDPCTDFYHYACGNWIAKFELPADRAAYNRQTDGIDAETTVKLNGVLADYAAGNFKVAAKYAKQLGAEYASCMDTAKIDAATPTYLAALDARLAGELSPAELGKLAAQLQLTGVDVFFQTASQPDLNDSSQTLAVLSQGGMSFQDKSYYFDTTDAGVTTRNQFLTHVANIFVLAGAAPAVAAEDAGTVLKFETALADKALATQDMQDSTQLNHPQSVADLAKSVPNFAWSPYFAVLGVTSLAKLNVATPSFFTGLNTVLSSASQSDIRTYLRWHVLNANAMNLSAAFQAENFAFWQRILAGVKDPAPRWKTCTYTVEAGMREALGEAYVNSFADPAAIRARAEAMIKQIKSAFGDNLQSLAWLDASTRTAALAKLAKVTDKVGFPEHWASFDGLVVAADDFLGNAQRLATYASRRDLAKIGQPTDRTTWDMAPWEQNAYYNPPTNEMVFPLGALVPPIFDINASAGANFGSIGGGWMGHELSHGFDSDGRHYDGDGNLNNWWTDHTTSEFDQRTQCLVDQANLYEVLPGMKVNGKQTLTENLADQGGVKMGYLAFLTATLGKAPSPAVGPFNERQQYWVAYAQSWCTKETPASVQLQINTNVHPPAEFRANAVLFNRPEFAEDFNCKAGSRMAPANRCSVW